LRLNHAASCPFWNWSSALAKDELRGVMLRVHCVDRQEDFHRSARALPAARRHAGHIIRCYDSPGHSLISGLCRVPGCALFGIPGLRVTDAGPAPSGAVEIWVVAVPELVTLAATVSRWEDAIVTAGLTGATSATSESLNRIAKLEARMAYGFRNPRTSAAASASRAPEAHDGRHRTPPTSGNNR
jgi:hypothetical protein